MSDLKKALERIVRDKDFSLAAAEALESLISQSFPEDERFEELLHILASYRPGGGEFLYSEQDLDRECSQLLKLI